MPLPGQRRLLAKGRVGEPTEEDIAGFVDLILLALDIPEVQQKVAQIRGRAAVTASPSGRGRGSARGRHG